MPPAVYDGFFPGAHELREMFQYFVEHTYFGPDHEQAYPPAAIQRRGEYAGGQLVAGIVPGQGDTALLVILAGARRVELGGGVDGHAARSGRWMSA